MKLSERVTRHYEFKKSVSVFQDAVLMAL